MSTAPTRADFGENFTRWDSLLSQYSSQSAIPLYLAKGICMNESSLGLNLRVQRGLLVPSDIEGSKSEDGKSWGLMQLTLPTAKDFDSEATPERLNDPEYSVRIACQFLRHLYIKFQAMEEFTVKAYNQGEGTTLLEKEGRIVSKAQTYWNRYRAHKELLV